jgi:glycosyltransferase involved in cell wall biosynthesis
VTLSVVIATYNRRDTLEVTLACLCRQTLPADQFEVIVVDDGSTDNTRAMVEALIGRVPYRLRYFHHANRGPGATENRGIREASADLVLMIADDIHAEPTMLEHHVRWHQRRPDRNLAALSRVLQSPNLPDSVFLRHWDPFGFGDSLDEVELPYWKFWACSISVKRSFLLENGLYRELKGAAHEDVELGYRLCREGLRIFYLPQALAFHFHVETLESACRRAYERGVNWSFIEQNVNDPEIHVYYHLLTRQTLKYHYDVFRRRSKMTSLHSSDRSWLWLLFRHAVRRVMFNRVTVNYVWLPFLRRAETDARLAPLVTGYAVRGAVFHHFIKGYADNHSRTHLVQRPAGTH